MAPLLKYVFLDWYFSEFVKRIKICFSGVMLFPPPLQPIIVTVERMKSHNRDPRESITRKRSLDHVVTRFNFFFRRLFGLQMKKYSHYYSKSLIFSENSTSRPKHGR